MDKGCASERVDQLFGGCAEGFSVGPATRENLEGRSEEPEKEIYKAVEGEGIGVELGEGCIYRSAATQAGATGD